MPGYTYCGTTPRAYPETRGEDGVIVGTVSYGDTRDFAKPPDAEWFPSGGPLPARLPREPGTAAEPPSGTSGTGGVQGAAPAPGTAASGKPPQSSPAGGSGAPAGSPPSAPASTPPAAETTPAAGGQKAQG